MIYSGILSSTFFTGVQRTAVARAILAFWNKYRNFPDWHSLSQVIFEAIARTVEAKEEENINKYLRVLKDVDTSNVDYVVSRVIDFARERSIYLAFERGYSFFQEGKQPQGGYSKLFDDAIKVGINLESDSYIIEDNQEELDRIMDKITSQDYGIRTGYTELDQIWRNGWGPGWLISILAPPKRYKCHTKGTGILMFDGSVKKVEDITVGDLIMGDDSTPRRVLTCGKGRGPLYKVKQADKTAYGCNDVHILCVKHRDGRIKEIEAKEYARQSAWFKRQWKGYKASVCFPLRPIPLDPYFMGLWLGDGTAAKPEICVADGEPEIADYLHSYATKLGMRITFGDGNGCRQFQLVKTPERSPVCSVDDCSEPHRAGGMCHKHYCQAKYRGFRVLEEGQAWNNPVTTALHELSVFQNKHIPDIYKINSRAVRLELLAGLIDSDGSFQPGRGMLFTNSNHRLAQDVCWLARSIGFRARLDPVKTSIPSTGYTGVSWRVEIMGNLSEIPTLLPRKRGTDSIKNTGNRCSIKVTPDGEGDYYGFTIDGNQRYLLEDFTVTHNTAFCVNLAVNMIGRQIGLPIFYYPCEITQELAALRCLQSISGQETNVLWESPNTFREIVYKKVHEHIGGGKGRLMLKGFPSRTVSIAGDIRTDVQIRCAQYNIKRPRAIFVDFAETVKPSTESKSRSEHRAAGEVYVEARALGAEFQCPVIMPDRCNKDTVGRRVPNMTSFQGAFEKGGHTDIAIGLCADDVEFNDNIIRYFVFLNRHGHPNQHLQGRVDASVMRMTIDRKIPYDPEGDEDEEYAGGGRHRRQSTKKKKRPPVDEIQN